MDHGCTLSYTIFFIEIDEVISPPHVSENSDPSSGLYIS